MRMRFLRTPHAAEAFRSLHGGDLGMLGPMDELPVYRFANALYIFTNLPELLG